VNKSNAWLSKLKLALVISIVVAFIYTLLSYLYVDNLAVTGVDPLGEESQWDLSLVMGYTVVSLLGIASAIFLVVTSIGFMFRTAQWLKGMDPSAIDGKPGVIIAAYFIPIANIVLPFRYLLSMNKSGQNSDEEKAKLKTLIMLNLGLAVISLLVGGNQWADLLLGAPEQTVEEVVFQEWRGIIGGIFDMGAMATLFLLVTPIHAGLAKRDQ
jgi:hypothetical protein